MGGKNCLEFIFIGLGEVLASCLHTLLRDQTPCSSLSKKLCEFWFILVFFFLEKGIEEEEEAVKAWENKTVRLVNYLQKAFVWIIFIWILIKKRKENTMEFWLQGLLKKGFQVIELLILFGKWFF